MGALSVHVLQDWLSKNEVLTTADELSQLIASYSATRYTTTLSSHGQQSLSFKHFLEYIVLPSKKDKLRDKVLKRSGLSKQPAVDKKNKKKLDGARGDQHSSVSGVSSSNQTDNSVERRKEEEQAKITSEFAMA